ncbi:MAG: tyrosine-type recombinase/integrase [Deltaproteobacteria bacterium]|nr:tyrosine-type recombinase/integrase [Deltaproteobacteria bacterium]
MASTDSLTGFRRHLKRKNYSRYTVRAYLCTLAAFTAWVKGPLDAVDARKVSLFIEHLLDRKRSPKTINCYLDGIRSFYEYLKEEEGIEIVNPVRRGYSLRLPRPLPRFLKDEEIAKLFESIKGRRDRAMFYLMLRCGLRVEEVARLAVESLDLKRGRIWVRNGKGGKDRMVYVSPDAHRALCDYLDHRAGSKAKAVFLVEKGTCKGNALSVRGIQKRIEHYARKSSLKISCHQLRHTMATQLLDADADITIIQDLLGHSRIATTQRYCRVSNQKVQREYYKAMEAVMSRTGTEPQPRAAQGP